MLNIHACRTFPSPVLVGISTDVSRCSPQKDLNARRPTKKFLLTRLLLMYAEVK